MPAFNAFQEKLDILSAAASSRLEPVSINTIAADDFDPRTWPVQPGDYQVIRATAPVAVLLLGPARTADRDFFAALPQVAVVGSLTTENIGVEYLVKNLISNPHIRHLMITGEEVAGHRPGDALRKLQASGLDPNGRIIDASGARPVLKNILAAEAAHFRKQITVHDFIGCRDTALIAKAIHASGPSHTPPFPHGLRVQLVDITQARPAKHLTLDPEGYFIILVNPDKNNPLYVEHYRNNGQLAHIIAGKDAATICATLLEMELISRLDHAAYVGRELARAELAVQHGTPFVQDRAQGETG